MKTQANPDRDAPNVIKDDHMPAASETRDSSWLVYAATFAVVLPILYIVSSGPAQCIERTETGGLTVGHLYVKNDLSIPYRQGSFAYYRWAPPIRKIFEPLEWLSGKSTAGQVLNWYWNLFGVHWHDDK
jgi:hypothetical protein